MKKRTCITFGQQGASQHTEHSCLCFLRHCRAGQHVYSLYEHWEAIQNLRLHIARQKHNMLKCIVAGFHTSYSIQKAVNLP